MLVSALVAGFVSSGTPAYAAPEEVLQSVEVALGADGTIGSVTSTSVHQVGEDARRESQGFDPTEAADELPVRVLTSYRLGDRAGTDLTDIEGESGRVVIEVTVQNTTVGAQELTFDSNGVQRSEYALVGTPLTVFASADLGADSMDQVVTADDVAPDVITNGVLSRGDDAGAQVQWATMLAPPRLGASTTFRLVLDAEDFTVPRFDLSVQPGLVADTSVRRLLEAAFSDDAGSTVSMESRTLELISDVNAVLAEAGGVLGSIEAELGTTAEVLGARTISDLQSSSTQVTSSMASLAADLDALSNDMGQRLREGNDSALAALRSSVDDVKALLGDPARTRPASVPAAEGCGTRLTQSTPGSTIYQQILAVSGTLRSLSRATDACRGIVVEGLRDAVGSVDEDCADSDSAICRLRTTRDDLVEQAESVATTAVDFAGKFNPDLLLLLQDETGVITGAIEAIRTEGLLKGENEEGGQLDDLLGQLTTVKSLLTGSSDPDVTSALEAVQQAQGALDSARGPLLADADRKSAVDQAGGIADTACEMFDELPAEDPNRAKLAAIALDADGTDCAEPQASLPGGLADRVTQTITALDVLEVDLGEVSSVVGDLSDDVDAVINLVQSGDQGVKPKVKDVVCAVESLRKPASELEELCGVGVGQQIPPLDSFEKTVDKFVENQGDLDYAGILEALGISEGQDHGAFTDAVEGLDGDVKSVGEAREKAESGIEEFVGKLGVQLDSSSDNISGDGRRVVNTQRAALDDQVSRVGLALDGGVTSAVQAIEGDVAASNRNLRASERLLLADLRKVLVDLGDRSNNGTGLLGALVSGATRTGVADRQITTASRTAAAFGSVRAQDLGELFLQQAQLARGLELQQEFPVFGLDLPSGSSHVTVFSFRLEGA